MKVSEAVGEFLASNGRLTSKTRKWYAYKLRDFSRWCDKQGVSLEEVKAATIRQYMAHLGEREHDGRRLADHTLHGFAQVVRTFLHWCSKEEDFEDFVSRRVPDRIEMPKVEQTIIEVFTQEELNRLFNAAISTNVLPSLRARNKAILSVMLDTGVRLSELVLDTSRPDQQREPTGLRLDNVSLEPDDSYIRVFGKGRKQREIGLGSKSRRALGTYMRTHREPSRGSEAYVFLNRSGDPFTVYGLDQLLKRLGEQAGIEDCHAHRFRHTFAIRYLEAGGSVYDLSKLLGHTSVKVTEVYLRAVNQKQVRTRALSVMDSMK